MRIIFDVKSSTNGFMETRVSDFTTLKTVFVQDMKFMDLFGQPRSWTHTSEGTLNAEQPPTAQTRSRNAFSFFQPAAGADFLAFLGINDA